MVEERGFWHKRANRRRVIQGAAAGGAGLAGLTVLGCSEEQRPAGQQQGSTTPTARTGGTLRLGTGAAVGRLIHLDPQIDSPVYSVHLRLIYQGLLGYDVRNYAVQPLLAKSWEQPSPTELIFTLEQGVKWQNKPPASGRALTAEDVVWSLERIRTDNPRFTAASLLNRVQVQAVDGSRVRLTTPDPDAAFLAKLSSDPLLVMARDVLERAGAAAEPGKLIEPSVAVGTGPFEITFFEEGVRAEYKKNTGYWRTGRPYLDGLVTPYLQTYQEAFAAFQGGQLDVAIVPGQEARNFIRQQGANYQPLQAKENGSLSFTAPNTQVKPFDDARVCRALRLLHDYDEIKSTWAETWYGSGRLSSYFNPPLEGWDLPEDELRKYIFWKSPKDEANREAISLLRAAGFDSSNPLRFELMGRSTPQDPVVLAQLVQDQWRKASQGVVNAELKLVETPEYQRLRAQRAYTYSVMTNTAGYVEPDGWFQQIYRTGASRNYWNNSDPRLDSMIDRQRTIFNANERKTLITEIVRYMIENSPGVTLAYHYYINATQPKVRDFAPEVQPQGQQYEWVWQDA